MMRACSHILHLNIILSSHVICTLDQLAVRWRGVLCLIDWGVRIVLAFGRREEEGEGAQLQVI